MIIESGVIIFLGLIALGIKLPRTVSLRMLGRPFLLDLSVSAVAFTMHYGTFSGVMAAAVAGLMTSGFSAVCRFAFGYITNGTYVPGQIWKLRLTKEELRALRSTGGSGPRGRA